MTTLLQEMAHSSGAHNLETRNPDLDRKTLATDRVRPSRIGDTDIGDPLA